MTSAFLGYILGLLNPPNRRNGSVCTVVWEGRSRETPPIPIDGELARRLSTLRSATQLNYQPWGLNCLSDQVSPFTCYQEPDLTGK
jgi:hypothetical protein